MDDSELLSDDVAWRLQQTDATDGQDRGLNFCAHECWPLVTQTKHKKF